jgi:hypothetical protein
MASAVIEYLLVMQILDVIGWIDASFARLAVTGPYVRRD